MEATYQLWRVGLNNQAYKQPETVVAESHEEALRSVMGLAPEVELTTYGCYLENKKLRPNPAYRCQGRYYYVKLAY